MGESMSIVYKPRSLWYFFVASWNGLRHCISKGDEETDTHRGTTMRGHREKMVSPSLGERPHEVPALPTPWYWTSSLQDSVRINVCFFSPLVCGPLLWWPQLTYKMVLCGPVLRTGRAYGIFRERTVYRLHSQSWTHSLLYLGYLPLSFLGGRKDHRIDFTETSVKTVCNWSLTGSLTRLSVKGK